MTATSTRAASARLTALAAALAAEERPDLGRLVDRLGSAGFGLAILALALPALVPVPGPLGFVLGLCLAAVAVQIMLGARRLRLAGPLRRVPLPRALLRLTIEKVGPWVARAETWLVPRRLRHLTGARARPFLGLVILALALALAVPIPFGNVPPVVALGVLALAMLARDGAALAIGLVLSAAAIAWVGLLVVAGAAMGHAVAAFLGFA